MKLSRGEKLFFIFCIVAVGAYFVKVKNDETNRLSTKVETPTSFSVPAQNETVIHHDDQLDKQKRTAREQELKKCGDFLSESSAENLESTMAIIKEKFKLSERLIITEYQLLGNQNEQIVVQKLPAESLANQIRVLKTASDGFPDRIKNFPNSTGSLEDRLTGALQLGSLQQTIDKYEAYGVKGVKLVIEKSENKIQKLNFLRGRNQLICEDLICTCQNN